MTSLKDALKSKNKLVVGSDRTMKAVRAGKIQEVFVSSNYPDDWLAKLEDSSKVYGFKLNKLKINSEELGASCRRPHSVIIIGLLK